MENHFLICFFKRLKKEPAAVTSSGDYSKEKLHCSKSCVLGSEFLALVKPVDV